MYPFFCLFSIASQGIYSDFVLNTIPPATDFTSAENPFSMRIAF